MRDRKELVKLVAAFAAVYLIWGSTYLAIRFAIETFPPFLMAGVRFIIAGSILYVFSPSDPASPVKAVHWKSAFITGGFLLLGGNGGVVWAEQYVPSGLTAVLIATVPLWVVVLSWIFKKGDTPSAKTIIGVLVGFAGLVYLVNPFEKDSSNVNLVGASAIMLAAFSWACGTVYTRHAVAHKSKIKAAAMQMLGGGTLLLAAGLLTGELSSLNVHAFSFKSTTAVLYLIFIGSIIGFTSYIYLISAAGPSRASTYAYVNPVVAVFLGWLMAGEVITLHIIFAALIIIASVAVINSGSGEFKVMEKLKAFKFSGKIVE